MAEIIKARVWQKVDTEANWDANPLILGPGEQAFVVSSAGVPINFKIGDGTKRFSELPWYFDSVNKAGFFGSASPSDSPTPASGDGFWIVSEAGTYTNFGGVVLTPNKYGFITRVGGVYELIEADVDLSYYVDKDDPRILPDWAEFADIDRPDLNGVVNVDDEERILKSGLECNPVASFDRPDLSLAAVDEQGRILAEVPANAGRSVAATTTPNFYNPTETDPLDLLEEHLVDYDVLISKWEALRSSVPVNPDYPTYITRELLGKSSTGDLDVWRYDFKPLSPKVKIILLAGIHASEKVYIHGLLRFMEILTADFSTHPALNWLRHNVHIIAIPCLCPSAITGIIPGTSGGRRVHETDPIPVTWTRSGAVATVSFAAGDFPSTRFDPNTYFSGGNIAGKTWVSIFDSSDPSGLPDDGYEIASVVNGRTITVAVPNSGGTSGTALLYVGVDPNRNFQPDGSTIWDDFTPNAVMTTYSNDYVQSRNDNKGTRPFSTSEASIMRDLLAAESDYAFLIDCHSGAGTNYLRHIPPVTAEYLDSVEVIKQNQAMYNADDFSRVGEGIGNTPRLAMYQRLELNKLGLTIEWSNPNELPASGVNDAIRWLMLTVTELSMNSNKIQ